MNLPKNATKDKEVKALGKNQFPEIVRLIFLFVSKNKLLRQRRNTQTKAFPSSATIYNTHRNSICNVFFNFFQQLKSTCVSAVDGIDCDEYISISNNCRTTSFPVTSTYTVYRHDCVPFVKLMNLIPIAITQAHKTLQFRRGSWKQMKNTEP